MPRFLSVTNSDTTSSILVASIIFAIVGLSIIIYIYSFSVFTMQNYYFSLKTQRETDRKVKMKHIKN